LLYFPCKLHVSRGKVNFSPGSQVKALLASDQGPCRVPRPERPPEPEPVKGPRLGLKEAAQRSIAAELAGSEATALVTAQQPEEAAA
jgi:hypothetical protein